MRRLDVAVVGAGPFGLSIAAHLPDRSIRVFGEPMKTWKTTMPEDMLLRSAWDETSLSAPGDAGSIVAWAERAGIERTGPIPLQRRRSMLRSVIPSPSFHHGCRGRTTCLPSRRLVTI